MLTFRCSTCDDELPTDGAPCPSCILPDSAGLTGAHWTQIRTAVDLQRGLEGMLTGEQLAERLGMSWDMPGSDPIGAIHAAMREIEQGVVSFPVPTFQSIRETMGHFGIEVNTEGAPDFRGDIGFPLPRMSSEQRDAFNYAPLATTIAPEHLGEGDPSYVNLGGRIVPVLQYFMNRGTSHDTALALQRVHYSDDFMCTTEFQRLQPDPDYERLADSLMELDVVEEVTITPEGHAELLLAEGLIFEWQFSGMEVSPARMRRADGGPFNAGPNEIVLVERFGQAVWEWMQSGTIDSHPADNEPLEDVEWFRNLMEDSEETE